MSDPTEPSGLLVAAVVLAVAVAAALLRVFVLQSGSPLVLAALFAGGLVVVLLAFVGIPLLRE